MPHPETLLSVMGKWAAPPYQVFALTDWSQSSLRATHYPSNYLYDVLELFLD